MFVPDSLRDFRPLRNRRVEAALRIPGTMDWTIACVAPAGRQAQALAEGVAGLLPEERLAAFSLAGYLGAEDPPSRVVLCPAGLSVTRDLAFLAQAAGRLLWPAPPARLHQAIGGLRTKDGPARPAARRASSRAGGGVLTALLLEGEVGIARARVALNASGPGDWVVEAPGRVVLPRGELARLARSGVRWLALEPVELVALYATPALARARARWKRVLPPSTRVWLRGGIV
jgi:hypothetical protein